MARDKENMIVELIKIKPKSTLIGYHGISTDTKVYSNYSVILRGYFLSWRWKGIWVQMYTQKFNTNEFTVVNHNPKVPDELPSLILTMRLNQTERELCSLSQGISNLKEYGQP